MLRTAAVQISTSTDVLCRCSWYGITTGYIGS